LQHFELDVSPEPVSKSLVMDLDGNAIAKVWFDPELTEHLQIEVRSQVETHCPNPFNYLLEPWASKLPIDYPASKRFQLQPYLSGHQGESIVAPIAVELAEEISHAVEGNTVAFLTKLNQHIYETCEQVVRETGDPQPPSITWKQKSGSCRDVAVLFMEVCRAMGLAARFVSGYQEGDLDNPERHLHAWAEVYLPGGGWRGYDPTHGLAVADRHIAVAASPIPKGAAPVTGGLKGKARSELTYELSIKSVEA
jgi:transglutaminase-like putative cysteine protease